MKISNKKPMNLIIKAKHLPWLMTLATGTGLAYSLAARFTDFMAAPRTEKAALIGALVPFGLIFSFWFFGSVVYPSSKVFGMRRNLVIMGVGLITAGLLFFIFYQPPPFPEAHKLELTLLDDKNEHSSGTRVEIVSIRTISLPDEKSKRVPVNELALKGVWQGANSGYGMVGNGEIGQSALLERFMQAGIEIIFASGPDAGKVRVSWDGGGDDIDLFSEKPGEITRFFLPALDWPSARTTQKILVGGACLAELWVTTLGIYALALFASHILVGKKITIRQPLLLFGTYAMMIALLTAAIAISQTVVFNNPPLEGAVRAALRKPEGEIYKKQLITIAALDASGQKIDSLEGIQMLPNLRELNLRDNRVSDLSQLSSLIHMEKLNLRNNNVRDLSPLSGLKTLEYLNLYSNTGIMSLEPIKSHDRLETLILANLPIGNQVITLAGMRNLKKLNLRNAGITDVSMLANLTQLEYLNLYGNSSVKNPEMLGDLKNLETLILAQIPINGNADFLSKQTGLRKLNLRETGIRDLSPLSMLENLEYLNLHSNSGITGIKPISGLKQLETLVLANVTVGDEVGILRNFDNLRTLNIRNTGVTDLSSVGELMRGGALRDNPKSGFLACVDIRDNPIQDLDGDDYEELRPFWEEVSERQPYALPFYAALDEPVFSQAPGFYEEEFTLVITTDVPGAQIHYTLDGSEPTTASPVYSGPLCITSRAGEHNRLAVIEEIAADYHTPDSEILKATVVRARVINAQSGEESAVVTRTYFVRKGMKDRFSLPVVSLATDEVNLFDKESGIYMLGKTYLALEDADLTEDERQVYANYSQRGRIWERPVSVEIIETDGGYLEQKAGARIHGGGSRRFAMKSLRIYARPEYDEEDEFDYPLFSREEDNTPDKMYTTFILRNAGQDWSASNLRDAFAQRLADGTGLDTQAGRFVIVFLNGEYWGVYNLQERYDERYLENHYGLKSGEGVIMRQNGELYVGEPDEEKPYFDLLRFMRNNDLAEQKNYEHVKTQVDIDAYIEYLIFEIYTGNQDWPDKNIYLWRAKAEGSQAGGMEENDGRWRWMPIDLDFSFGLKGDASHDTLAHAQLPGWSGFIFRELLKNAEFREEFRQRSEERLETTYSAERVLSILDATTEEIRPYMEEFYDRWGNGTLEEWEMEIKEMREYARQRPDILKKFLRAEFGN